MTEIIYTRIERAIVQRLRAGLGKMVRSCDSYGGELDDELGNVINLMPAAWVTFGGIVDTKPVSTSRHKYRVTGTWVVMIGEKTNPRGHHAGRQGGPQITEVGTYPLLYAVRRLLSGQDLGIEIDQLRPGRVRTLFNTRVSQTPMTAFAAEFRADWIEEALDNDRWPAPIDNDDLDVIFARHQGRLDAPYPDVSGIDVHTDLVGKP